MATKEELTQLEGAVAGVVRPIFTMLSVPNPAIAATLFGVSTVFRFLRLGSEIRKEIEQARKSLDSSIRAQGIFRLPIEVDTSTGDVLEFFVRDLTFSIRFPLLARQFAKEIGLLSRRDSSLPEFSNAVKTLKVAMRILPDAIEDRRFDHDPLLDSLFGKWLDPMIAEPDYYGIVQEVRLLTDQGELSLRTLADNIPEYVRLRLQLAGAQVEALTNEKVNELNQKIRLLILNDILNPDSDAVRQTLKFVVDRRVELIQQDIDRLKSRKADLEGKPVAERSEEEKKDLERIGKRITDLESFKERVGDSLE